MTPETAAALEASIAKWKRNALATKPEEYRISLSDCALCDLFLCQENTCQGCPVSARAGKIGCVGTPYNAAHDAVYYWHRDPDNPDLATAAREAALREVEFLGGLRE